MRRPGWRGSKLTAGAAHGTKMLLRSDETHRTPPSCGQAARSARTRRRAGGRPLQAGRHSRDTAPASTSAAAGCDGLRIVRAGAIRPGAGSQRSETVRPAGPVAQLVRRSSTPGRLQCPARLRPAVVDRASRPVTDASRQGRAARGRVTSAPHRQTMRIEDERQLRGHRATEGWLRLRPVECHTEVRAARAARGARIRHDRTAPTDKRIESPRRPASCRQDDWPGRGSEILVLNRTTARSTAASTRPRGRAPSTGRVRLAPDGRLADLT
jgi:hypothetical protein